MKKEAIVKFYQTYKLSIFPAVVALSSLVLIIFVIYPQTVKLITNQKVEGEILGKAKVLEAKAQTLADYDPQDLKEKLDFALSAYPADKDLPYTIGLLQQITAQSGFNVVAMNLGTAPIKSEGQGYSLKLEILGPHHLLPSLLSKIENSARLMRVSSLDVATGREVQGATISLNIEVLYAAPPAEFGTVDSPLPQLSEKDEEVIAKLTRVGAISPPIPTQLGPRGKVNPFE